MLPSRYSFCRAFLVTLNELNDYAGQHEVIAENLTSQIISELSRYLQDLKTERKTVSSPPPPTKRVADGRNAASADFASLSISPDVSRKLSE